MDPLQRMIQDAGWETRSYSGRGMYGKTCLGVYLSTGKLGKLLSDCIAEILSLYVETDPDDPEEVDRTDRTIVQVRAGIASLRTDHLGTETIVYFPSVPFTQNHDTMFTFSATDDST